jgi:hypothetical protein
LDQLKGLSQARDPPSLVTILIKRLHGKSSSQVFDPAADFVSDFLPEQCLKVRSHQALSP